MSSYTLHIEQFFAIYGKPECGFTYFLSKTNTTAVDPPTIIQSEVSGLTKNYCITISMQKVSLIQQIILEIHLILEYHDLKGYTHF